MATVKRVAAAVKTAARQPFCVGMANATADAERYVPNLTDLNGNKLLLVHRRYKQVEAVLYRPVVLAVRERNVNVVVFAVEHGAKSQVGRPAEQVVVFNPRHLLVDGLRVRDENGRAV